MSQTIDVTGLPPSAVRVVESLVGFLRSSGGNGPAPESDAAKWEAEFRAWAAGHPKRAIEIDDSRETIYGGRGE